MATYKFFMDYTAEDSRASSGFKGLGCEMLEELPEGRQVASEGIRPFLLTSNIELHRGHRVVTIKASPKKPIKGFTTIYPLGGDIPGWVHPMDERTSK